jgi:MinD-like ATPase involved in chromosome partitioning or flagellar assembly
MQILLLGAGSTTSRLNMILSEQGHSIAAQLAAFTPQHLDLFDFQGVVAVAPEASVSSDSLLQAAERGKMIFVIAGEGDGLTAWAGATGVPTFAYPPSEIDTNKLFEEIRRAETGSRAADEQYRRSVVGSDIAARIQSGMNVRKIAVTSPKGGTGKTTIAVNLAVAFALSGITTYLVDADGNAGSLQYHLRLRKVKTTMMGLLRRELARRDATAMDAIAAGATFLEAFTTMEDLPTLKVLPGLITDDLGDKALQNEEKVTEVIKGLYDASVASGGVIVMDVGINPAHVVHRAALQHAEGIAIIVKPEIPDLAETRRWIARMIRSMGDAVGREAAHEFIGSRVKLCYNQVVGTGFKTAHKMLQEALREDEINIDMSPNGIIPMVDAHMAVHAVNSDRRDDILIWRYKNEHPEELAAFADALIGFATHFVPTVQEGAARVGILPRNDKPKQGVFGKLFGR